MTLMPVSKISVLVDSDWNFGAGAWIGRRCFTATGPP